MRHFVIVGQRAVTSGEFRLDDLPSSSGRLDVLVRCLRAALLLSHGLRSDVVAYLILCGGPGAPVALRVATDRAKFIRPDERSLATLLQKTLLQRAVMDDAVAKAAELDPHPGFVEVKPGIAHSNGGLDAVLGALGGTDAYLLDARGEDIRASLAWSGRDIAFFVGDHLGFDDCTRSRLVAFGARPIRLGPAVVHAEDAIAIAQNEVDRHDPAFE